jgi:DNA topoisomerase-2
MIIRPLQQSKTIAKSAAKTSSKAIKSSVKPKPKGATKKKVLVDVDENADDSGMDVSDQDGGIDERRPSTPIPAGKKKTASETYTKVRTPV